jgi:tRNA threonylcarbamoyladenosine modification (KEOPS) complex Cgi121 subunit
MSGLFAGANANANDARNAPNRYTLTLISQLNCVIIWAMSFFQIHATIRALNAIFVSSTPLVSTATILLLTILSGWKKVAEAIGFKNAMGGIFLD